MAYFSAEERAEKQPRCSECDAEAVGRQEGRDVRA